MILDIVVDVQKDFITGALANPQAQANVAHLAESVKAHARAGHWLFLTRDTHPDNYLATREGRHLPVEHCIEGEDGWNFCARAGERAGRYRARGLPHRQQAHLRQLYAAERDPRRADGPQQGRGRH